MGRRGGSLSLQRRAFRQSSTRRGAILAAACAEDRRLLPRDGNECRQRRVARGCAGEQSAWRRLPVPSVVRPAKIMTLNASRIVRRLGALPKADQAQVVAAVRVFLAG